MDILATFRIVAPEFAAKTDDQVNAMIEMTKPHVSSVRFGSFYSQAVALRAAHEFAVQTMIASAGSGSGLMTGGAITGEREGDLQRTYAQDMSQRRRTDLDRTYYGQRFQQLSRQCIVSAVTRMGDA